MAGGTHRWQQLLCASTAPHQHNESLHPDKCTQTYTGGSHYTVEVQRINVTSPWHKICVHTYTHTYTYTYTYTYTHTHRWQPLCCASTAPQPNCFLCDPERLIICWGHHAQDGRWRVSDAGPCSWCRLKLLMCEMIRNVCKFATSQPVRYLTYLIWTHTFVQLRSSKPVRYPTYLIWIQTFVRLQTSQPVRYPTYLIWIQTFVRLRSSQLVRYSSCLIWTQTFV